MLTWGQAVPRRIKLPSRYQILVTRPGGLPFSFSLSRTALVGLLALLFFWAGATYYLYRLAREAAVLEKEVAAYAQATRRLTGMLLSKDRENRECAAKVAMMLDRLDRFEEEIRALKERAGLKTEAKESFNVPVGAGRPADIDELFAALDARVASLEKELKGEVAPALERTLKREAATPRGYPLRVKTYLASGFGVRKNPFGRGYEFHDGVDLPAPYGTPVYATAAGRIIGVGWSQVLGRYVRIDHGYGYQTLYGHLSRIGVRRGQWVERGQTIGWVGSTGRSTGPHVHYSVFRHGKATDPRPYLSSRALSDR